MKLESITLQNFRCMKEMTLTFHPEVTVLIARNGEGKTTLIDAARIAVWPFVKAFDLGSQTGKSATIQIEDVRLSRSAAGSMEPISPSSISASGSWSDGGERRIWKQTRKSLKRSTKTLADEKTKQLTTFAASLQDQVRSENQRLPVQLPLIAYLGTGRLWYQGRYPSAIEEDKYDMNKDSRLWGYQNCITATSSYKQFEGWYGSLFKSYREQQILQMEGSIYFDSALLEQFRTAIEVVTNAVNEVTKAATGWRDLAYSSSHHNQLVMSHKDHGSLALGMLSEGLRNIVVLVADIAFRAIKLNPQLGASAALETDGIVMIDEVDLFLHPAWQQTIIASLRRAFPKIQFIVTTHSPQVLTTVPSDCIRILEGGAVFSAPRGSQGADSSRILKRIFGVDSRPQADENTQLLMAYEKLVYADQWKCTEAIEKRTRLDQIFAGEEPKLTELDLYIENRRWELELEKDS